jgi:tRNA G10  N-methylase Trm11
MAANDLDECFEDVDWSFSEQLCRSELDGIHPYPAKFIAEIPVTFLERLTVPEGCAVLDPFVGSGTTLAQAQRFGYSAIGIDLNPIACLMTRVKTNLLPQGAASIASTVFREASEVPEDSWHGRIPNVDHWFQPAVKKRLGELTAAIDGLPAELRDIARLALSSIVVRVSNQDSDTRYAAVSKKVTSTDVDTQFKNSVDRVVSALSARDYELSECLVIEGDALEVDLTTTRVGAIITSPPYPNAYEYWLYHKYRMYWLGHDPVAVKGREIGARAHFFKKNGHTAHTFRDQMTRAFAAWAPALVPNGWIAIVVGRSRIHGEIVDNATMIQEVARDFGFDNQYRVEREILRSRKSFNLSHANIASESVLVMRR